MNLRLRFKRKKKGLEFDPNSEYITEATRDFLTSGGKINRLELCNGYEKWSILDNADSFLKGEK